MPKKTKDILDILNAFDSKEKWGGLEPGAKIKDHNPLFPRIK
jgi:hypothetical protein